MRFTNTFLILLVVIAGVSWLNYWLLARWFGFYRGRFIRYSYCLLTVVTLVVMWHGLAKRPLFATYGSDIWLYLIYGVIALVVGQFILLLLQPIIAVFYRLLHSSVSNSKVQSSTQGITRRTFLTRSLAAVPIVALGVSTKGIYEAQAQMAVRHYSLAFPQLPGNLQGFKLGQISDTHLGPYFGLESLDTVIQLMAQQKPDLVVLTGDFADNLSLVRPAIAMLNEFQQAVPYGMYFCYGNHDYFQDVNYVRTEFNKSRIKILKNESTLIVPGVRPFYLMGVDYPWNDNSHKGVYASPAKRQECFTAASSMVPPDAFKILIAHHPDFLFNGFAAHIPLTLAGHTHGGQIVIGGKSILSSYAYMQGLYREQGVYGYVDSGAGHWFPFRLGCPPQISLFTFEQQ